jgi:hypothetical protein
MAISTPVLAAACLLVFACGSESRPPEKVADPFAVFTSLPLPPDAKFVSRAGSADALQITMFSPSNADTVVSYYRGTLSTGRWRLVSDQKKPDGKVVLYAEQDGPPLWVSVWPTTDGAGTMVQLVGAALGKDSVKAQGRGTRPARKTPT